MFHPKNFSSLVILSLMSVFVSGCLGFGSGSSSTSNTGTIRLLLTDSPFPFDLVSAANVTIDEIDLHSNGNGFVRIMTGPTTVNLVNLQNGVTDVLANAQVPVGEYDQVRLVISAASIDLKDGTHFDLTVPSGASSGLKIFVAPPVNVVSSVSTDLLLDFDVSDSFATQGNPITGFSFNPVIRAVNMTTAGTLSGTVVSESTGLALQGALVTVAQSGNTVTTAVTDINGSYTIIGLLPGLYDITISKDGYPSQVFNGLIVAGNVLDQDASL